MGSVRNRKGRNVWRERVNKKNKKNKKEKDTPRVSSSWADHDRECDGDALSVGVADSPQRGDVGDAVSDTDEERYWKREEEEEEVEEERNLCGTRDKWGGNAVSDIGNVATPCNAGKQKKKRKEREISAVAETNEERDRKTRQRIGTQEKVAAQGGRMESVSTSPEWTVEQEVALRRAYILVKPSPHFWKKVSKMVEGKSAQECFDRMHSKITTPVPQQPRSRATKINFSPLGFSDFFKKNAGRSKSSKKKSVLAHKTVRHILRKQSILDQGQEADLFSVLETSPCLHANISHIQVPSTPEHVTESSKLLQRSSENLSFSQKKTLPRFKPYIQGNLATPEVLKPVKNIQLHEKYIDQLHCREAKRRMHARAACSGRTKDNKENHAPMGDVVKTATTALISEAREIIFQFEHANATHLNNTEDTDGSEDDCEEDA